MSYSKKLPTILIIGGVTIFLMMYLIPWYYWAGNPFLYFSDLYSLYYGEKGKYYEERFKVIDSLVILKGNVNRYTTEEEQIGYIFSFLNNEEFYYLQPDCTDFRICTKYTYPVIVLKDENDKSLLPLLISNDELKTVEIQGILKNGKEFNMIEPVVVINSIKEIAEEETKK